MGVIRDTVDAVAVPKHGTGISAPSTDSSGGCQLEFGQTAGLQRATIGNDQVRAEILLDKGANVRQLWHVPTGARALAESNDWAEQLAEFRRNGCGGINYSDCYEGGWQDVLPVRARWNGGATGADAGVGEAATVPWEVICSLCTPVVAYLICRAKLPLCGLEVLKRFDARRGAAALWVETTVRNTSGSDVWFSWTQHPALGGDLLDDTSVVWLPGGRRGMSRDCGIRFELDEHARPCPVAASMLLPEAGRDDRFLTFVNVHRGDAALASHARGIGVRLRWDRKAFPHVWLWCARRAGIECVAVEPSTTYLPELKPRPEPEILRLLKSGDSIRTRLELSIFSIDASGGLQHTTP